MICSECKAKLPAPTYVEDIAYFVCESCGHCEEIPGYIEQTLEERIDSFKKEIEVKLPKDYLEFDHKNTYDLAFEGPKSSSENIRYYSSRKYWSLEEFFQFEPVEGGLSIFESENYRKEWDLPEGIFLIAGSGHYWYALDYRRNNKEPEVIFIESENADYEVIGKTFKDFQNSLVKHEQKEET